MTDFLVPLLAPSETLTDEKAAKLNYPLFVSPKYDGIRATIQGRRMLSRTCMDLPNQYMLNALREHEGIDSEIVCGDPTMDGGFNYTQSVVMGNLPNDDWKCYVFDLVGDPRPFEQRVQSIADRFHLGDPSKRIVVVPQYEVKNVEELLALEYKHRAEGWEGVMVRSPKGLYPRKTEGELRCSLLQQNVMKFKRFEDSEGTILKLFEGQTNNNPAVKDVRGKTKRSTNKANMVNNGHCGGFLVRDPKFGWDCVVSPGRFKKGQLKDMWDHPEKYIGRTLKYSFQLKGQMTLPRFPVALGFRDQME